MGANERFDRAVRVHVTDPEDPIGNVIEFEQGKGLRMRFDILKTNDLQPNTGVVQILNLNETTRQEISGRVKRNLAKPLSFESGDALPNSQLTASNMGFAFVRLFAGYGSAPEQILEGVAGRVSSVRPDLDWVTSIPFGDAEVQLRAAVANKVFGPGTPLQPVIQYLIDTLGVATSPSFAFDLLLASTGGDRIDFPKGISLFGPSRDLLTQLLSLLEIRAQITDGEFTLVDPNGAINVAPLVITELDGLLEAPKPLEDGTYEITSDLEPQLAPGRLVTMITTTLSGSFVVEQVRHRGDTHGSRFRTTTELRTLGVAL